MISFVNAKINIGLYIVERRPDGYHNLQTLFYPIGRYAGTPDNSDPFCDILEVVEDNSRNSRGESYSPFRFSFLGRKVDCPEDKNLVCRAAHLFAAELDAAAGESGKTVSSLFPGGLHITLEKHLPDGAGLGGGSADASFLLRMLNDLAGHPFSESRLEAMALRLGADCPFFIRNTPGYAEGVGECLSPYPLDLSGYWLALVKPDIHISTAEAFAGVKPSLPKVDLREVLAFPPDQWRGLVENDFEKSLFPTHPVLASIKESLYASGASYASMSGSGSSIYGIFNSEETARMAVSEACSLLGENSQAFSGVLKL